VRSCALRGEVDVDEGPKAGRHSGGPFEVVSIRGPRRKRNPLYSLLLFGTGAGARPGIAWLIIAIGRGGPCHRDRRRP